MDVFKRVPRSPRPRWIVIGAVLVIAIAAGVYFWPKGATPGAQRPYAAPSDCISSVSDQVGLQRALEKGYPGDRICAFGDFGGARLVITKGGTPEWPMLIFGDGKSEVKGITITADNVVLSGFNVVGGIAPGILMRGNNITVEHNTVAHPTGEDHDGLRFFGANLKILHNTISYIDPERTDAHADCMQSFATGPDAPASQNVLIDGNVCLEIDNQCLIVEGPHSSAGDGSGIGVTKDVTFSNNFCDANASQAVQIDDVQNVRITDNDINPGVRKAFSFQNNSTGAVVEGNDISPCVKYEIGMDASSRRDYRGPDIGGRP